MGNTISDMGKLGNRAADKTRTRNFDGIKTAKLGSEKNPAVVIVQTEARRNEISSAFEERGWSYKITLEPDKAEDITDLTRLLNPPQPRVSEKKIGRNEPCRCGSGKKYKHCCWQ